MQGVHHVPQTFKIRSFSFKLLVAAAVFATSFTVGAQTIFSTSGYSTGEALEKPMVMKPFVEFSKARPLPELRIFRLKAIKKQRINLSANLMTDSIPFFAKQRKRLLIKA